MLYILFNRILSLIVTITVLASTSVTASEGQNVDEPPGQLVDIGGYKLHIRTMGQGSPTVVIDVGVGAWSIFWQEIQQELAQTTEVFTYDRAGYGWSDPSPFARTVTEIALELHSLLVNAEVAPPYILVGHSYGGYTARLFADLYPEEVAGIVLVESAHERQWEELPNAVNQLIERALKKLKASVKLARTKGIKPEKISENSSLSDEQQLSYKSTLTQSKYYEAFYNEIVVLPLSVQQVAGARIPKDIPLAVVTAANSFAQFQHIPNFPVQESNRIWLELQRDLLELSSQSKHFISDNATHRIQLDDPRLIIEAVHFIFARADRGTIKAEGRPD